MGITGCCWAPRGKTRFSQHVQPLCHVLSSLVSRRRTPTPFDRAVLSDLFYVPAAELDPLSGLELLAQRPNFNRVPQGWARVLPETDEL